MKAAIFTALLLALILAGCAAAPALAKSNANNNGSQNASAEPKRTAEAQSPIQNISIISATPASLPSNLSSNISGQKPLANNASSAPRFDFSNITDENGSLIIYYFFSANCEGSKGLRPTIDDLKLRYPGVVFKEYNISETGGWEAYADFVRQYNIPKEQQYVPHILVNGTTMFDRFTIEKRLEPILRSFRSH